MRYWPVFSQSMQNLSLKPPFSEIPRVRQATSVHCGPAVLEMLAYHLGLGVDQQRFVSAAGVGDKLRLKGMTVSELGLAATRVVPEVQFWYKANSAIRELYEIVMVHHFPVGVEWQGDFYSGVTPEMEAQFSDDEDEEDDDSGHYSMITYVNTSNNVIFLADPYKYYAGRDRRFTIREFENRWWDINEVTDPDTGRHRHLKDNKMMFIVVPRTATFPEYLGMTRFENR